MGNPIKDLTSQTFNRLTAIEMVRINLAGRAVWRCICSCGNVREVTSDCLVHDKVKSCGCAQVRALPVGVARFNKMFKEYQSAAQKSGRQFLLSRDLFYEITQKNCYYCGGAPKEFVRSPKAIANGHFIGNGIDRIDNSKGYLPDNVLPCCKTCNKMKGVLGIDDFIGVCQRVAFRHTVRKPVAA